MTRITTHILDLAAGGPAAGVAVTLEFRSPTGWSPVAAGSTDGEGRVKNLLPEGTSRPAGTYRLRFDIGDYFDDRGSPAFYPYVEVVFTVKQDEHCHVPLLVSPFGYSTYRGT